MIGTLDCLEWTLLASFAHARANVHWNIASFFQSVLSSIFSFSLSHGGLFESVKLLRRDFHTLNGNALGNLVELLYDIVLENELQFLKLSGQNAWLNAFEFADVSGNNLTLINDVVVLAALVDEEEIVIHIILLLVGVGADHHVEGNVIRIVLVILEVVQLDLGILHPVLRLFKFPIIDLLQIFELLFDVL